MLGSKEAHTASRLRFQPRLGPPQSPSARPPRLFLYWRWNNCSSVFPLGRNCHTEGPPLNATICTSNSLLDIFWRPQTDRAWQVTHFSADSDYSKTAASLALSAAGNNESLYAKSRLPSQSQTQAEEGARSTYSHECYSSRSWQRRGGNTDPQTSVSLSGHTANSESDQGTHC